MGPRRTGFAFLPNQVNLRAEPGMGNRWGRGTLYPNPVQLKGDTSSPFRRHRLCSDLRQFGLEVQRSAWKPKCSGEKESERSQDPAVQRSRAKNRRVKVSCFDPAANPFTSDLHQNTTGWPLRGTSRFKSLSELDQPFRAATPGSSLPSRSSSRAPPPVLT